MFKKISKNKSAKHMHLLCQKNSKRTAEKINGNFTVIILLLGAFPVLFLI
jgi:hypothetical protein